MGGEKLGQRSQTGADFDHVVAGLDLQASDNPAREVLVVQKILAEAAGRGRLRFRKGTLDFAQCHFVPLRYSWAIHNPGVNNPKRKRDLLRKLFTGGVLLPRPRVPGVFQQGFQLGGGGG